MFRLPIQQIATALPTGELLGISVDNPLARGLVLAEFGAFDYDSAGNSKPVRVGGTVVTNATGRVLSTNGTSDYVSHGTSVGGVDLFADSTRKWSVVVFSKKTDTVGSVFIAKASSTPANRTFQLFWSDADNKFYTYLRGTFTAFGSVDNNYHQITVTWDGTTAKGYVDSATNATLSVGTASLESSEPIIIGARTGGTAFWLKGEFGYVLVFDRAISQAEHLAIKANPRAVLADSVQPIWVGGAANTVITCTVGNASATGPTARLNRAVKATVGNAGAAGVTAALNRKIVTQVGDAVAAGVGASLSRRILTSSGDAQAAGVASQVARTILTTPGDAACSGVQATISVAGSTTITCIVGDATATGVDAVLRRDVTITCTPGDAGAAGVTASILAPTIVSCTVGNAVAAGVTALLETSMTLTSADIAAIAKAVWAHPEALTVKKFLGLK